MQTVLKVLIWKDKIFSTHVLLPRLLVTSFLTELDTNHRDNYYSGHILEAPMSVSFGIKIKVARSSETWINFHLVYTSRYPRSQYSQICITMAHQIMAILLRISITNTY